MQLYEAMEAIVHIFRDGCRTIGPHDKAPRDDQGPCAYPACKSLEALARHFAGCKMRSSGGCIHCKRMWQILELHSRLCPTPDGCSVPLCRSFLASLPHHILLDDVVRHVSIDIVCFGGIFRFVCQQVLIFGVLELQKF